jgi:DNA-directed RNA polymerase specialized sigma24 family protein
MAGSGERGGVAPPPAAVASDLQPEDQPAPTELSDMAKVAGEALATLHEWAAQRLEQLEADQALVQRLRETGFEGEEYAMFTATLASYGYPVLLAWIRRREIYRLTFEQGRPVDCSDELKEHLSRDVDDRQELAMDTVAQALVHFRKHALLTGVWTPAGGARLTTFFVGSVVQAFPNAFRAWKRGHVKGSGMLRLSDIELDERLDDDPADRVCLVETFHEAIESAAYSPRLQHVLAARVVQDAQYREIAEELGVPADQLAKVEAQLKQLVYRWRVKNAGEGR